MTRIAEVTYVNETAGHGIGQEEWPIEPDMTMGELFRIARKELGRCISRVYVDRADGKTDAVGWVFEKRDAYQDTHEPYLRHAWVTIVDVIPEQHIPVAIA